MAGLIAVDINNVAEEKQEKAKKLKKTSLCIHRWWRIHL